MGYLRENILDKAYIERGGGYQRYREREYLQLLKICENGLQVDLLKKSKTYFYELKWLGSPCNVKADLY